MKPSKANQKPKGKKCTFETQTNNRTVWTTWRLKKNPNIGFKQEIEGSINCGDEEVKEFKR